MGNGKLKSFSTNRLASLSHEVVPYDPISSHEVIEFNKLISNNENIKDNKIEINQNKYAVLWVSGKQSETRNLSAEKYIGIIKSLYLNLPIKIVAAPLDKSFANELKDKASQFTQVEMPNTDFNDSCDLLRRSSLLIAMDSAPVHLASYFNIPCKAIFTSGIITKWKPLAKGSTIIRSSTYPSCAPCTLFGQVPKCPNKLKCMENFVEVI